MAQFSRIQQKMVDLLSDGYAHPASDLHACLRDELTPLSNIAAHLVAIRKLIRPEGYDVVCHRNGGGSTYMMVRMLQK